LSEIAPVQLTWFEARRQFGHRYWTEACASSGPNIYKLGYLSRTGRTDVYKQLSRFNISLPPRLPARRSWKDAYTAFGHEYWSALVKSCGGSAVLIARLSGTYRTDVYKKLKRFHVALPGGSCRGHRGNWGDLSNEEPSRVIA
jgi:hypothetical protein